MALELSKIVQNKGFRSLCQKVFIRLFSNLVNMLVGIIFWPSSITSRIPYALLNNGPWIVQNCLKLGLPLSKSKSFHPVCFKLGEYFGGHNILTKFYNQPNPFSHSSIMAFELSKIRMSALLVKEFSFGVYRNWWICWWA